MTAIHVEFTRPVDLGAADRKLAAHGLHTAVDADRSTIEIECLEGESERTLHAIAHTLDEWLVECGLPFTAVRSNALTLVVRPPAD